jgi:AraC-like DNA-binding protein
MWEPRTRSELQLRLQNLGKIRDRLHVESWRMARCLEKLRPDQGPESVTIKEEIRATTFEAEHVEADIVRIQYRLKFLDNPENEPLEKDSKAKDPLADLSPKRRRTLDWTFKAMLLVEQNPEWSDAKIAEQVGISPSQLSRSDMFQAASGLARGDRGSLTKGFILSNGDGAATDVVAISDTSG